MSCRGGACYLTERAQAEALTGLYNRRGWDQLLAAEEERCRRFGHPASTSRRAWEAMNSRFSALNVMQHM